MKSIISFAVAAALALSAGTALAGNTPSNNNTSVSGSVTSGVSSGTFTNSHVYSANGSSNHWSVASANNTTAAGGLGFSGPQQVGTPLPEVSVPGYGGVAATGAGTYGTTRTVSGGEGYGSTVAGAQQFGFGNVSVTQNIYSGNVRNNVAGQVTSASQVYTNTQSVNTVTGTGHAENGSMGYGLNVAGIEAAGANGHIGASYVLGGHQGAAAGGITHASTINSSASNSVNWVNHSEQNGNVAYQSNGIGSGGDSQAAGQTSGSVTSTFSVKHKKHH
jgi:hypothetical protein